ncbi:hypothetical protein AB0K68_52160, partial [Streptomyces sp. NPDC050698]
MTNASGSSPVDDEHTNRSHVGEAISDGRNYPGYLLIGLGLATLGLTLVAAGYGFRGWAVIAGAVCEIRVAGREPLAVQARMASADRARFVGTLRT